MFHFHSRMQLKFGALEHRFQILVVAYETTVVAAFFGYPVAISIANRKTFVIFGWCLVEGALVPLIVSRPYPSRFHLPPGLLLTGAVICDRPYTPLSSSSS